MQKVLIVGEVLELGRTEEVYGRGFADFGCEVKHFNWTEADPSFFARSFKDKLAWRLGWQMLARSANQKLLQTAKEFQPDLTLIIAPNLVPPESIQALKKYGLVFIFYTDNPFDLHHTHSNTWVRSGFSLIDAAFIWSQELVDKLIENGVKNAFFHPFCSDVQYHYPKKQSNPLYDVAFIGNWDPSYKREKYLKAIADYRLGIWGTDYWVTRCTETSLHSLCKGACSYSEIPEILGSAKMGLNILRPQNETGHNIRTFEIPACGVVTMSERTQELLNLFIEDKEAVYFSSPEELKQKVEFVLQNENEAKSIAEGGYKKALSYTINQRIVEIFNLYTKMKKSLEAGSVELLGKG
jgi:spore maturation protein CgeB